MERKTSFWTRHYQFALFSVSADLDVGGRGGTRARREYDKEAGRSLFQGQFSDIRCCCVYQPAVLNSRQRRFTAAPLPELFSFFYPTNLWCKSQQLTQAISRKYQGRAPSQPPRLPCWRISNVMTAHCLRLSLFFFFFPQGLFISLIRRSLH